MDRVCPFWLRQRREDLVQAALVRVLEAQRRGEGQGPVAASYGWKAAYCAVVDEIRRHRRRREMAMEDLPTTAMPATAAADPERLAASREAAAAIGDCLARLVAARRLAVTLHLQGHSLVEASHLLGWATKRCENLIYRGLADLRRCLAAKGLRP